MKRTMRVVFAALLGAAVMFPGPWTARAEAAQIDAAHELSVEGEGELRVRTRWYELGFPDSVAFAVPLPPGSRVLSSGATPILGPEDQALVGLRFDPDPGYPLVFEVQLPWTAGEPIPLPLPVEAGWQRVEVEGEDRLVLELGAAVPMHSAGYYAPGRVHINQRLSIDRHLDRRHPAGAAYIPGEMLIEAGGVSGRIESGAAHRFGLGLFAGAVFFSGLLVFVGMVRRQGGVVAAEEAEAYLAQELRELATAESRAEEPRQRSRPGGDG